MSVYVIVDIQVEDPEDYKSYVPRSTALVEAHGGRFLARGGHAETLEGDWQPGRVVLIEFPDLRAARAWYDSPEYQEVVRIRHRASISRGVIVQGAGT